VAAGTDPKVYSIPAGASFLEALAAGLLERYGADPLGFSRATILLPTRRACRALAESFLRLANGRALLLPSIRPLGDIDEDELDLRLDTDTGGALPMPALERSFLLTRLLKPSALADGHTAHAFQLAESLGALLDGAITEGIGLDNLPAIVPENLAEHWQATLKLLAVIRENWSAIKAEDRKSVV
jgi:ATP-dependent helicase/nuclease subunit B